MFQGSVGDDSESQGSDVSSGFGQDVDAHINHYRIPKLMSFGLNGSTSSPKGRSDREFIKYNNDGHILSLTEMAAQEVACHLPFGLVESFDPPVPEPMQCRIAFWSFPQDEEDVRLYTCLANGNADVFIRAEELINLNYVCDMLQVGFHLSANVKFLQDSTDDVDCFRVAITFDRRRITSCSCSCTATTIWCQHAVAVCLQRIRKPLEVTLRAPVSESLQRLEKNQLQKFAQYLINELPQQILPAAQKLLDELLSGDEASINQNPAAPDPTAGATINEHTNWCLDDSHLSLDIQKILLKQCTAQPTVCSDIQALHTSAPPASAEYSQLLRPIKGREPEGLWNLISIVGEMMKRHDSNFYLLLEIMTQEVLKCDRVVTWWFETKVSLHSGSTVHFGASKGCATQSTSQYSCSNFCDDIVHLWRLAALDPNISATQKDRLYRKFFEWHLKIVRRHVAMIDNSGTINGNKPSKRHVADLFPGFRSAMEGCLIRWDNWDEKRGRLVFRRDISTGDVPNGVDKAKPESSKRRKKKSKASKRAAAAAAAAAAATSSAQAEGEPEAADQLAENLENQENIELIQDAQQDLNHDLEQQDLVPPEPLREQVLPAQQQQLERVVPLADGQHVGLERALQVYFMEGRPEVSPGKRDKLESLEDSIKLNLKRLNDPLENLYAQTCGLCAHGFLGEARRLAVQVGLDILACPNYLGSKHFYNTMRRRKKKGGLDNQMSIAASEILSKINFLSTVLLDDQECHNLIFRLIMYGIELKRSPAATKPLEVKLIQQKHDLIALLKSVPLREPELAILRQLSHRLLLASKLGATNNQGSSMTSASSAQGTITTTAVTTSQLSSAPNSNIVGCSNSLPRTDGQSGALEQTVAGSTSSSQLACDQQSEFDALTTLILGKYVFEALSLSRSPSNGSVKSGDGARGLHEEHYLSPAAAAPNSVSVPSSGADGSVSSCGNPSLSMMGELAGRHPLLLLSSKQSGDVQLGFQAALSALATPVSLSETDHPLLCEGTRRQRGELALLLLTHYKDDQERLDSILKHLLDGDVILSQPKNATQIQTGQESGQDVPAAARDVPAGLSSGPAAGCVVIDSTSSPSSGSTTSQAVAHPSKGLVGTSNSDQAISESPSSNGLSSNHNVNTVPVQNEVVVHPARATSAGSKKTGSSEQQAQQQQQQQQQQPTEASAHYMFELAKTVFERAGGNSMTTHLFRPQVIGHNGSRGIHRRLHMCSLRLALYALDLQNRTSSNWMQRTYNGRASFINEQALEIGLPAIKFLCENWEGHLTPVEVASIADKASCSSDTETKRVAAEMAKSCLKYANHLDFNAVRRVLAQCRDQSIEMVEEACNEIELVADREPVCSDVLFVTARTWHKLVVDEMGLLTQQLQTSEICPCPSARPNSTQNHHQHLRQGGQVAMNGHNNNNNNNNNGPSVGIEPNRRLHLHPANSTGLRGHHPCPAMRQLKCLRYRPDQPPFPSPADGPMNSHQPVMGYPRVPHAVPDSSSTDWLAGSSMQTGQLASDANVAAPNPLESAGCYPGQEAALPATDDKIALDGQGWGVHGISHHLTMVDCFVPAVYPQMTQKQREYIQAAYRVGMKALEALKPPQNRCANKHTPRREEDVMWLLGLSKSLGRDCLHQFAWATIKNVTNPMVLNTISHDLIELFDTLPEDDADRQNILLPVIDKTIERFVKDTKEWVKHMSHDMSNQNLDLYMDACQELMKAANTQSAVHRYKELLNIIDNRKSGRKRGSGSEVSKRTRVLDGMRVANELLAYMQCCSCPRCQTGREIPYYMPYVQRA